MPLKLACRIFHWAVWVLSGSAVLETAMANSCIDCHQDPDFYVQARKLHVYYREWLQSPHSAAGLTCDQCHGGDPTAAGMEAAHRGVLSATSPDSRLHFRNQPDTCGACHAENEKQFKTSKHYQALRTEIVAPTCTTCHRAMSRRPYYRDIVSNACRTCHNEQNADHIPLVADRAEEILHRLNVAKAYLGWTYVYFDSEGWPGQSRQEITALQDLYSDIVSAVHGFDLTQSDDASTALLTDLKVIFQQAWDERQSHRQPPATSPQEAEQ